MCKTLNIEESESIRGSFASKVEVEKENESEKDDDDDDGGDNNGKDLMVYDDPGGHPGDHQDQVPQDCQTGKYTEQEKLKSIWCKYAELSRKYDTYLFHFSVH